MHDEDDADLEEYFLENMYVTLTDKEKDDFARMFIETDIDSTYDTDKGFIVDLNSYKIMDIKT